MTLRSAAFKAATWREAQGAPLRTFLTCLLIVSLSTADQSLFSYAIPEISREFGLSLTAIGTILALSFGVASGAVVCGGLLSDRLGRRRVLVALLALSALFVGFHAFAHTVLALSILRILGFATGACLYPLSAALVVETAPARLRGFMTGTLQIGYPIGFALASIAVRYLMAKYGWRLLFWPAFAVPLFAPLLLVALPKHPKKVAAPTGTTTTRRTEPRQNGRLALLWDSRFRRTSLAGFLGTFFCSFAVGGITYFLPTFLVQARGYNSTTAGVVVGSAFAVGAAGYLVAAAAGEFLMTRRNTLVLWVALGAVCLGAVLSFPGSHAATVVGFGAAIFFFFGAEAVRVPLIGELFPTEIRATAMSTVGSLSVTIAYLIAPLLITTGVAKFGWTTTLYFFAFFPLTLGAFAFSFMPSRLSGASLTSLSEPSVLEVTL